MRNSTVDTNRMLSFKQSGFDIIDDCASSNSAEQVYNAFLGANWDQTHVQERPDHYKHVFKFTDPNLPKADECYKASFKRSSELEANSTIQGFIKDWLVPSLENYVSASIKKVDTRCIAMHAGGFMRAHVDDYAGAAGFIFYVNKRWCSDWGGLLAIKDGENLRVFSPQFNRLIVIGHKQSRLPHFVTQVADYALEERFAITGFCEI